ncbi:hypothetical protein [Sporomusa termitida]|uniref:Uncharacterized protein n=1 Tax=Sporomusa termitida TaxID=2377 RepID=A0A517E0H9_9FIRM|nr:hypothetical protein [Sporomusa termitida]QDR83006.1 hypothetical protein SPTER_44600 [Sporomusa termitida]
MTKTIILDGHNPKLANALTDYGFQVVDITNRSKPGHAADAYLYTSYRPDTDDCLTSRPGHADICIGNYHYNTSDHPDTVTLNITGLTASQIADILIHKLAHRPKL